MNLISALFVTRNGRILLACAAGFLALWIIVDNIGDQREERVRAAIEKHNREKADAAAKAARNSDQCHDAGGRWLQFDGRCVLSGVRSP